MNTDINIRASSGETADVHYLHSQGNSADLLRSGTVLEFRAVTTDLKLWPWCYAWNPKDAQFGWTCKPCDYNLKC